MESRVRHFQLAVLLACGIAVTGCAVTSGLQTYDLPTQGAYQTDQGAQLTVVQLTQDNLPSLLLNNIQSANSTEFVSVIPGVNIRKGAIVCANSVASKSLPSYVIAVGTPAKPIKFFAFDKQRWQRI